MIEFADTSIRLYRKRSGAVSVRWRSHLLIHAKDCGFRLAAYLNKFDATLRLAAGQMVQFNEYAYSDYCLYEMDYMVHDFWASGTTEMETIADTVGLLRVEYRLFSFERQGDPSLIERVVPVLARGLIR